MERYGSPTAAIRSEAVRDLLRDMMVAKRWKEGSADENTDMVGVVSIVYKHVTRELSEHLTEMQHHHHTVAQAALHIHLNPEVSQRTVRVVTILRSGLPDHPVVLTADRAEKRTLQG